MKQAFLKNVLKLYISTGITAAFLCCINLTLLNYRKNLDLWASQLSRITVNAVKMKTEVEKMKKLIDELRSIYPSFGSVSSREALLGAADEMRRMLPGCNVALSDIMRTGGELVLPMTIRIEKAAYSDVVAGIGYLQTFTMPYVSMQAFSLEQTEQESGEERCTVTLQLFLKTFDDGAIQ
ncbi:MAG: hypothetical protein N3B18_11540 [Desulfobacterota bacterium]|nr:hypothetical protein [Thermodesulfobacteriota bacterium]